MSPGHAHRFVELFAQKPPQTSPETSLPPPSSQKLPQTPPKSSPPPSPPRIAPVREAYVALWYGNSSSRLFDGVKVLVHSIRTFDRTRPFLMMRPHDESAEDSQLLALGVQLNITFVRVPRLVSTQRVCLQTASLLPTSGAILAQPSSASLSISAPA